MSDVDLAAVQRVWDESRESGLYLHGWTVYDHPRDFPDGYVVREWRVGARLGGQSEHSPLAATFETLDEARRSVPSGLARLERSPDDDPVIIESWL